MDDLHWAVTTQDGKVAACGADRKWVESVAVDGTVTRVDRQGCGLCGPSDRPTVSVVLEES